MRQDAPLAGLETDVEEPFAVTPSFVLFLTMLFLPVLLAAAVYTGAWFVADDVYAADASEAARPAANGGIAPSNGFKTTEVADWKRTLVGVCPLH